jgi:3-methyladenine DNA glycosylase AlkD
MWKRRSAIIAQLHCKEFDAILLSDVIGHNALGSTFGGEFFIQKAIGWALRQRAKQAPAEVQAFVRAHSEKLAPLSQREALKHVGVGENLDSDLSSAAGASSEKVAAPAAKKRRVATRGP